MSESYKFQGWMGVDKDATKGKMVWQEFEPKEWEERDVDVKITHCGICGSDLHTLRSGWGATEYPCCVGHEVVGKVVKVGSEVKDIKVGDRVGVGAQTDCCGKCEDCKDGRTQHCTKMVGTYAARHFNGGKSYGGYADYWRGPATCMVKIPDSIPSAEAAPMLCGGVTVWSPLKHNGAGPGKRVGVIGVGGLGHFAVLFAKALGCDEVVAIQRNSKKKDDITKMGADRFIATEEEKDWNKNHARSLDLIISTVSSPNMPIAKYLQLLRPRGNFIQVGAPEDVFPPFAAFSLIGNEIKFGGSIIGSPDDIREMLDFVAKKGIKPWIEERPMKDANKTVVDMDNGDARYRYVLVNEKHANA